MYIAITWLKQYKQIFDKQQNNLVFPIKLCIQVQTQLKKIVNHFKKGKLLLVYYLYFAQIWRRLKILGQTTKQES